MTRQLNGCVTPARGYSPENALMVVADDVASHRKLLSVLVEAVTTALWCSVICQAMRM